MGWHDAIGEDVDGEMIMGLGQGAFEGDVVLVMAEERNVCDGAVEDVIGEIGGAASGGSWHWLRVAGGMGDDK